MNAQVRSCFARCPYCIPARVHALPKHGPDGLIYGKLPAICTIIYVIRCDFKKDGKATVNMQCFDAANSHTVLVDGDLNALIPEHTALR